MMERVETRPADMWSSGLSLLEPDMEAYSTGSRKNLKHDEEKPHAAGSKTEKKRKEVPKKLIKHDDEKESHAAGSKKKAKAVVPDRTLEEILEVTEEEFLEEEEPGLKWKTVKLKLDAVDVRHLEEYTPSPPYPPSDFDRMHPMMRITLMRAAARHEAYLESRKRAVQQFKDTGFAELEIERLEEDKAFDEIQKFIHELEE